MENAICLLNDSFAPVIDGVANAVMNYAKNLSSDEESSVVITPDYPGADDSQFPYPVLRYPSLDLRKSTGYTAGIPFAPELLRSLEPYHVQLLHSHCPIVSTMLARELRQVLDVPLILTYHTKFDIDIANIMHSRALQEASKRALLENINACDEVWAVSQGAADNLRSLGYEGECVIMHNGVDLPRGRVRQAQIDAVTEGFDLPVQVPVYLFVGRIMWYKGLRIILDALAALDQEKRDFRMVFVGGGGDFDQVKAYSEKLGLAKKVFFAGPVHQREALRAWYCRADLFLFPSTFDTNGLVVREAAACALGSVLIAGSCAAEGVTNERNGLLIEENAQSLAHCLCGLSKEAMSLIGSYAQKELYLSWEDAVKAARERYQVVIDRYNSGAYAPYRRHMEPIFKANGELMEGLARLEDQRAALRSRIADLLAESKEHPKDIL